MKWKIIQNFPEAELEQSWRECLAHADYPTHYTAPEYFLEPFWADQRPFAVLALDGNGVTGVVTGLQTGSQIVCGLPARPQVCQRKDADQRQVSKALSQGLLELSEGKVELITLHTWTAMEGFQKEGYSVREWSGEKGVAVLDLAKGPDALFKGFSQTRRTDIRNAIKMGLEVTQLATDEEFNAFYEVYVEWCKRKQFVPNSFDLMKQSFALTNNRRLFIARYENKVVAGVSLRFIPGGIIEYSANCSIKEYQKLRPNDILHWRVIEWACKEGFTLYSLGGAHLFLRRFGGALWTTYRYRFDRTWFRQHEIKEKVFNSGLKFFQLLPDPAKNAIRKLSGINPLTSG
ncbi:MAG: GNAT family N-acetyltransferase [Acidobacteria bacterium]|nr:GNAT family N-acetyltransferase [Acidobacteriota bacterium]